MANTRSTTVQPNQKPFLSLGCDLYQQIHTENTMHTASGTGQQNQNVKRKSERECKLRFLSELRVLKHALR